MAEPRGGGEDLAGKKHKGGRTPGAEGYNEGDIVALLAAIRAVLPTGPNDWDVVLREYRRTHATPNERAERDVSSIKKFSTFINSKKPTGNPDCPFEIREAKAIQREIKAKVACATLNTQRVPSAFSSSPNVVELDRASAQRQATKFIYDQALSDSEEDDDPGSDEDDVIVVDRDEFGDENASDASAPGDVNAEVDEFFERVGITLDEPATAPTPYTQSTLPHQAQVRSTDGHERCSVALLTQETVPQRADANHARSDSRRPPAAPVPAGKSKQTKTKPKSSTQSNKRDNCNSLVGSIQQHLKNQQLQREISNSERFLALQLKCEREAKEYEQHKRQKISDKLEKLKATVETLREDKERLRDRLQESDLAKRELREQLWRLQRNFGGSEHPFARDGSGGDSHVDL